jgi:hypothetical protein
MTATRLHRSRGRLPAPGDQARAGAPGCKPWTGPHLALNDALTICLAMLADDPSVLSSAATMWRVLATHVRSVTPPERSAGLAALQAAAGRDPLADVRALRVRARRDGLLDIATALENWLACREA